MKNTLIIANPTAGRGQGQRLLDRLPARLAGSGFQADIQVTTAAGEARDIARNAAQDCKLIVALGGDGTIQEVAGGLAEARLAAGKDQAGPFAGLGILPAGTGNDLIKAVGIPLRFDRALATLQAGRTRHLDLGRIRWRVAGDDLPRERIFVNNVGLGFEGRVGWEADRIRLPLRGTALYLLALLRVLRNLDPPHFKLELEDGTRLDQPMLLVSVGNGTSSGGGFRLNPDADPFDGMFDICTCQALGRMQLLGLLPRAMKGTHPSLPPVSSYRQRRLELESDPPCHGHADGELLGDDIVAAQLEILPGILPLVC
jgi:diacylglycerol kinase (ATP)